MAAKSLLRYTPGDLLLEEFLKPMEISQYQLAKDISVPPRRIHETSPLRIGTNRAAPTPQERTRRPQFRGNRTRAFCIGISFVRRSHVSGSRISSHESSTSVEFPRFSGQLGARILNR